MYHVVVGLLILVIFLWLLARTPSSRLCGAQSSIPTRLTSLFIVGLHHILKHYLN